MASKMKPESGFIYYKAGYKYQVNVSVEVDTGIIPNGPISTELATLSAEGLLKISAAFAWDGPSGPTLDTPNFMAASLCHDEFYEMLRLGLLPAGQGYRKAADKLLRKMCRENGMTAARAWWVYRGVRLGAGPASKPKNQRKILKAPAAGWRIIEG